MQRTITKRVTGSLLVLALAGLTGIAAMRQDDEGAPPPPEGLAPIRALAGDWVALDEDGKPGDQVVASYHVTAAGSAVVETSFGGTDHEMVTVYHMEGDRLALTHYCVLGNQPHMVADPVKAGEPIVFRCAGGSNVDCPKGAHMHEARLSILGPDRLHSKWTLFVDGKPAEVAESDLVRER